MDHTARLANKACRFGDRLNDPGFIVREHDRENGRAVSLVIPSGEARLQRIEIDDPLRRDVNGFDGHAGRPGILRHGFMLNRRDKQGRITLKCGNAAMQRQRVGFGAAAGEDDVFCAASDGRADRLPRPLYRLSGCAAGTMDTGRICPER